MTAALPTATLRYSLEQDADLRTGWLVDRAPTGVAFLTSEEPPCLGAVLHAHTDGAGPMPALVRRVVRLSGGLVLVAATFASSF